MDRNGYIKMKVLSVFGTRPEAIKMCPVIKELNNIQDFKIQKCILEK